MPLYIRDEEVRRLAARLAEARRITVTDAVRAALLRELADLEREAEVRDRRLRARFARLDALPRRRFGDAEMYDELGLPK
jgi:hypothetical protein